MIIFPRIFYRDSRKNLTIIFNHLGGFFLEGTQVFWHNGIWEPHETNN
jgi:hypothetical protein